MRRLRPAISIFVALIFSAAVCFAQSPDRELRGILTNPAGEPVKEADIRVRAVTRASGTRYGEPGDVEPSTKTDAKGEFIVHGKTPFLAATITAEAPGYAKGAFTELATGGEVHTLTMLEGVTVVGAVIKDGKPLAGMKLGLCDTDRGSKIFTLDLTATTDANGHFELPHVPPKRDYFLFGFMHSFADKGALPSRRITATAEGSTLSLGDLIVEPSFLVEGHLSIQLPHIPILLSRYHGRDAQTVESGALGQFHFAGVPGEIVTISADAPGYRLTLKNASLNPADPTTLVGRVITNKTDFIIDIETGAPLGALNIPASAAAEEVLRGAEPSTPGPNTIKVSATVTDANSGEKIASFITTEGRVNERAYDWFFTRAQRHQNGELTTYLTKGERPPVLVVQANDHLPWVSGPITSATNFDIKLARGAQAKGVVLKPDGQPAANVAVYLSSPYGITTIRDFGVESTAARATTDSQGRFAFAAQSGVVSVMVFDAAGFADTSMDELLKTGKVRLQSLAKIEGKLLIGSAPGTNEVIYLATAPVPYHWYPLELPAYSITFTTRTDTNGKFSFDRVPPTLMEIAHSLSVNLVTASGSSAAAAAPAGAFRLTQTQRVLPHPGETLEIALGGKGRAVVGRIDVGGGEAQVDWHGSPQSMELIVPHEGPGDGDLKALTEKLRETRRRGATPAQRRAAEDAYARERQSFATATQKYFETEKGMAAVLASHRYHLQLHPDGAFRIDDVPPGKYRITGMLLNNDPAALSFTRKFLGRIDAEVTVPDGTGQFEVGTIKALPVPPAK